MENILTMVTTEVSPSVIAAGIGAVTVVGAFGYLLGKRTSPELYSKNSFKLQRTKDPVLGYIGKHCTPVLPVQEKLIEETLNHPRSMMLASRDQQQLLHTLVKTAGAKKTLDIGVYTGYSALSIALALPDDGKVVACDVSEEFTNIGKSYWKEAGVSHKIDLRIAPAADTLDSLINNGEAGTYDYAFIDADKPNYPVYYEKCLTLLRKGGILAFDNVLWGGAVIDPGQQDESTACLRKINEMVASDSRVIATMLLLGDGTTVVMKK